MFVFIVNMFIPILNDATISTANSKIIIMPIVNKFSDQPIFLFINFQNFYFI